LTRRKLGYFTGRNWKNQINHKMKSQKIRDQENEQLLAKLLGRTEAEYKLHRLDKMLNYISCYCRGNSQLEDKLIDSSAFEAWWVNHWNRGNEWIIHRYCLRSWKNRQIAGRKVRINQEALAMQYEHVHEVSPEQFYPPSAVFEIKKRKKR